MVSSARLTAGRSDTGRRFESHDVLDRRQARFDSCRIWGLGIDADERLGAARAKQHPAAVIEVELEAIVRPHSPHLHAGDLLRLERGEPGDGPVAVPAGPVAVEVEVWTRA